MLTYNYTTLTKYICLSFICVYLLQLLMTYIIIFVIIFYITITDINKHNLPYCVVIVALVRAYSSTYRYPYATKSCHLFIFDFDVLAKQWHSNIFVEPWDPKVNWSRLYISLIIYISDIYDTGTSIQRKLQMHLVIWL